MNFFKSRYREQLSEIINQVKRNAENAYVQQFVDLPRVSRLRLQLLYLFLQEQKLPENKIRQYCISTALIQMGLDIHEVVPLDNQEDHNERFRQLLVLSGDYYSSRYYYLLAEIEDTETIKMLAETVQMINETKMKLYDKHKRKKIESHHYLTYMNVIDTSLYTSYVTRYSDVPRAWTSLIQHLVQAERLLEEYRLYKWEKKVQGYLSLVAGGMELYQSVQHLVHKVEELLQSAREKALALNDESTRNEILQLITDYAKQIELVPNQVAEEL
ncbi:MAG: heptaprenyl diphosphate synthase component 1 [Bacillaceae bacterium]|nr:heptaprenyl diphosphate synthase component 1 [Bacillaceae bacterium]